MNEDNNEVWPPAYIKGDHQHENEEKFGYLRGFKALKRCTILVLAPQHVIWLVVVGGTVFSSFFSVFSSFFQKFSKIFNDFSTGGDAVTNFNSSYLTFEESKLKTEVTYGHEITWRGTKIRFDPPNTSRGTTKMKMKRSLAYLGYSKRLSAAQS